MNGQLAQGTGLLSDRAACREKYWSELSDAERVERMREILKRVERRNEELQEILDRIAPILTAHQHDSHGRVLITADLGARLGESLSLGYNVPKKLGRIGKSETGNPDDVYF